MTTKTHEDALSPGDYEALADLRYALRRFTEFSNAEVSNLGMTPQQHQALLAIKGLPPEKEMTIGMLAERLLIAPHSATELVNRLSDAGYIERLSSKDDGRRQIVRLMDKADGILAKLSGAHLHEIREMAPELMQALRILQDRRKLEKIAWMA
ncbi:MULTISPECIES: MarR family winged helix-turn-helix transcriptional regulator [Rhizobium]|jgi:DNA-binding MarR family transcriptional regulator|uniref:DNA-binding transcriptional regulator, MarR family n=1 Tax=Rhizobium lusitanum TaxID=293958 RepID=A0A1C3WDJ8_9HYPH|nr:helix-turn-helix domain-containing protein [Rhizobium lusitanum]SCB37754.1 DNA-binding transcriptional regulator, MarR family [Rhizobium lusitanum]